VRYDIYEYVYIYIFRRQNVKRNVRHVGFTILIGIAEHDCYCHLMLYMIRM
jgi:hypothetical protein